jgi:hypothetical protein
MGTRPLRLALSWGDTADCLATNFANVNKLNSIIVVSCCVLYAIDTLIRFEQYSQVSKHDVLLPKLLFFELIYHEQMLFKLMLQH